MTRINPRLMPSASLPIMAYLLILFISTFFLMIDHWNLGPYLIWLSELPPQVWSGIILMISIYKIVMWLQTPYYTLKKLIRRLRKWIDEEDQTGPGSPSPTPGANPPGSQRRSYSTSVSSGPSRTKRTGGYAPFKTFKERAQKVLNKVRISSSAVLTAQKINDTFSVKGKGLLAKAFSRMLPATGNRVSAHTWRVILRFIRLCVHFHQKSGMKGLVLALKAATVLTSQAIGGFRLQDPTPLKFRLSRNGMGLPRKWIDRQDRARIRLGETRVIRLYLTLFSLYRVLEFPGTLKLSTITAPMKTNSSTHEISQELMKFIPHFANMLSNFKVVPLSGRVLDPYLILRSGPGVVPPNVSTTPKTLVRSWIALIRNDLMADFAYFVNFHSFSTHPETDTSKFNPAVEWFSGSLLGLTSLISPIWESASIYETTAYSGKLGIKHEPAGKERVFAMVDAWTHWALTPLHSYIFDILKHIPMDGTHDQLAPINRMLARGFKSSYSLDLSAATDRIPLSIQTALVAALVNDEYADHWQHFLVSRGYVLPTQALLMLGDDPQVTIKYAVGQPMGAKSSWSMLAIIHHCIIQYCAVSSGVVPLGTWFRDYAVLGDDVVIFNPVVKARYVHVMTALGVEMGIEKSLLSTKGTALEFAKRIFFKGVDVSPVPMAEFISANLRLSDAIQFSEKYRLNFPSLLFSLGWGYRVRNSIAKPLGRLNTKVRALYFAFFLPKSEEEFTNLITGSNPVIRDSNSWGLVINQFSIRMVSLIVDAIVDHVNTRGTYPHGDTFWSSYGETMGQAIKDMSVSTARWLRMWFFPTLIMNRIIASRSWLGGGPRPEFLGHPMLNAMTDADMGTPFFEDYNRVKDFFPTVTVAVNEAMIELCKSVDRDIFLLCNNLIDLIVNSSLMSQRETVHQFMGLFYRTMGESPLTIDPTTVLTAEQSKLFGKTPFEIFQIVYTLMKEFAKVCDAVQFNKFEPPLPYRSDPTLERF